LPKKGYRFVKYTRTIRKISALCFFLFALTREEDIEMRSGRAGPPFSARPEKEAKGAVFARHVGSGKMKPQSNPFSEPSQTRRFTSS
ncbi:MAG: hypothetical protein MR815_01940, partial [Oscillospiraceae bacterium]|nr:hypothetical protein [Oscillospiraceae bacterium]